MVFILVGRENASPDFQPWIDANAGEIPARVRQTHCQTGVDRVAADCDYRDCRSRFLERRCHPSCKREHKIEIAAYDIVGKRSVIFDAAFTGITLDQDVPPFDVAEATKSFEEGVIVTKAAVLGHFRHRM